FERMEKQTMERTKKPTFLAIGFMLLAIGVLLINSNTGHGAAPPPTDAVKVINTTAEAVPVAAQGTTNIAGTGRAQQSGTWNVSMNGTPPVQLDNNQSNPLPVRNVDGPTRQPFQQQVQVTLDPGALGQNAGVTVPSGKLMVIEQVSAQSFPPAGQKVLFSILTHVVPDLTLRGNLLQTTSDTFGGSSFFMASQSVHIYADAPGALVRVDRDSSSGTVNATFV